MRTPRRCLVFAVLLCGSAAVSSAQNLLRNGTFDDGISPWTPLNNVGSVPVVAFSPLDAGGSASSGSIRITTTASEPFVGGHVISECFPVVAGVAYQKLYEYRIEPGQATTVSVTGQLNFFSDPVCSIAGSLTGYGGIPGEKPDEDVWLPNRDASDRYLAPPGARGARLLLSVIKPEAGGSGTAQFDNVAVKPLGDCSGLDDVLCLNDGRFQVTASWRTADDSGRAHVVQLTDDTGYLWFFDSSNVEVVVKVLDACETFGRYWVFAGGLTNVEVEILVTDTLAGETNTYRNELGEPFAPLQDTDAFATCGASLSPRARRAVE